MSDREIEIYRQHRTAQEQYCYLLLAAAAAAIGFAVQRTTGLTLDWFMISLAGAVLCWSGSFYFGCAHLNAVSCALYANVTMLQMQSGSHPDAPDDVRLRKAACDGIGSAIGAHNESAARFARLQFRFLVAGAVSFMMWHVCTMLPRGDGAGEPAHLPAVTGVIQKAATKATASSGQGIVIWIGALTLAVTCVLLYFAVRDYLEYRRASQVWRTLDDCMAEGYSLQERGADYALAAQWITRVSRFCERALGTHAMKLMQQNGTSPEAIQQSFEHTRAYCQEAGQPWTQPPANSGPHFIIQQVLNRIHQSIADKVVPGRIHPGFRAGRWMGWNPTMPERE